MNSNKLLLPLLAVLAVFLIGAGIVSPVVDNFGFKSPGKFVGGTFYGNGGGLTNIPLNSATGVVASASIPTNALACLTYNTSIGFPTAVTFRTVTNAVVRENVGFNSGAAAGTLTNLTAGIYQITARVFGNPPADTSDTWGLIIATNNVQVFNSIDQRLLAQGDVIAELTGIPITWSMGLSIFVRLPANTQIAAQLQGPAVNNDILGGELTARKISN